MGVSPAGAFLLPARLFRMPIVTGHSNRIRNRPGNRKHCGNRRHRHGVRKHCSCPPCDLWRLLYSHPCSTRIYHLSRCRGIGWRLTGANAQGYQGHDQFQVVESCLARRFPIYKPGDSNAKATGGQRQICYKLKAGEAGFILQPTSVLKF